MTQGDLAMALVAHHADTVHPRGGFQHRPGQVTRFFGLVATSDLLQFLGILQPVERRLGQGQHVRQQLAQGVQFVGLDILP